MSAFIDFSDAQAMVQRYQGMRDEILDTQYQSQNILAISETFSKSHVQTLLNHIDCEEIRIYYGMDENLKIHAILVGVDQDDNDIVDTNPSQPVFEILEESRRCPDNCPPGSAFD
jgi:hypothetical protein